MRIGIDIRNIGKKRTGDEAVFFNLVKNLALIDNKNEYFLLTDIQDEKILAEIKNKLGVANKNNFSVISIKSANKFFWNFWTLPKYLRKNPVDVFQTQYITPWFVPEKVKIATIIHDISFNFYPQLIKFADLFFLKLLIPWSLRRADKIIGVSRFTAEEIKKYYQINSEKVAWAHNAVAEDFGQKEISDEDLEKTRAKYDLPEKFILYLGTLQPRKNLPFLIEAYANIEKEISGVKLVLAGAKNAHNFDKNIEAVVRDNQLEDSVIFPGFVDEEDKVAVYKLAQAFCFPSLYEGFGIPILEAMSLGIPVLASDIAPHQEITEGSALLFKKDDRKDLESKLVGILQDDELRQKMIKNGLNQAEKFSWQKTAQKFLRIWTDL